MDQIQIAFFFIGIFVYAFLYSPPLLCPLMVINMADEQKTEMD